jgi:hypothetical protein
MLGDGRYEQSRQYFTDALTAPGGDELLQPFLLRALGQLYATPNTQFANPDRARDYFQQALRLLEKRPDDTGHLTWAETRLNEANVELIYGDRVRAQALAHEAKERLVKVRSSSPLKTQLEGFVLAIERGEQVAQSQQSSPRAATPGVSAVSQKTMSSEPANPTGATGREAVAQTVIEIWPTTPGQVSGVEMTISIDGRVVGAVSNLKGNRELKVNALSPGVHAFTFADISAYFVDPVKEPTITANGFSCAGVFELRESKTVLKANVGSGPNGLMCVIQ